MSENSESGGIQNPGNPDDFGMAQVPTESGTESGTEPGIPSGVAEAPSMEATTAGIGSVSATQGAPIAAETQTSRPGTITISRTALVAGIAGVIIVALVVALVLVLNGRNATSKSDTAATKPQSANQGEVFLSAAYSPGPNPFTPPVAKATSLGVATTSTTAPVPSTTGSISAVKSIPGNQVGLYGGTLNYSSCNAQQMVTYLSQNQALAHAWAGAEGIPVSSLSSYILSLTPVVLRADTRVTNHGYSNGIATPEQSILQAGTAVLVDDYGVPRAKCFCGNPLTPPMALTAPPAYVGPQWPTFDPASVVVVVQQTVIQNLTIVDTSTGDLFSRPVGTDGAQDGPYSVPSTTLGTTSTVPAPTSIPPVGPPAGGSGTAQDAIAIFENALGKCGGPSYLVSQQEVSDSEDPSSPDETPQVTWSSTPEGPPTFEVTVNLNESGGTTENSMSWTVNVSTQVLTPIDSDSRKAAQTCSALG